jgi:GDP-mannose transporter
MFASAGDEYNRFWTDVTGGKGGWTLSPAGMALLLLGCIAGTGIGYSSWWCRDKVSATSFTLIGVMNKCLTILLNVMVWDKHAPPGGIASLVFCLVGGAIYQQSPMRAAQPPSTPKLEDSPSDEDGAWHDSLSSNGDEPLMKEDIETTELIESDTMSRRRV